MSQDWDEDYAPPLTEVREESTPHGKVCISTTYFDDATAQVVIHFDGVETERLRFNDAQEATGFAAREFACLFDTRSLEEKLSPLDPINN